MNNHALELVTAQVTAPGVGAAMAAVAGNSLTVRDSAAAKILSLWGQRRTSGFTRITSPLLHDAVVGFQHRIQSSDVRLKDMPVVQDLQSQDTLTLNGSGSVVAGDIETSCMLILYNELAGICANLITWEELKRRAKELYSSTTQHVTGGAGGYSGEVNLIASEDQLKANQDYAILGATSGGAPESIALRYRAPDWGNLGVGLPVMEGFSSHIGGDFFVRLSKMTGLPVIPVFNASNKSLVLVDIAGNENVDAPQMTTNMALLGPKTAAPKRGSR